MSTCAVEISYNLSVEELDITYMYPGYDTEQSDGKVSVLEL